MGNGAAREFGEVMGAGKSGTGNDQETLYQPLGGSLAAASVSFSRGASLSRMTGSSMSLSGTTSPRAVEPNNTTRRGRK